MKGRMHALAADGQNDTVDCGAGNAVAFENANEHDVFVNCERVIRKSRLRRSRPTTTAKDARGPASADRDLSQKPYPMRTERCLTDVEASRPNERSDKGDP